VERSVAVFERTEKRELRSLGKGQTGDWWSVYMFHCPEHAEPRVYTYQQGPAYESQATAFGVWETWTAPCAMRLRVWGQQTRHDSVPDGL
jgi:hypothetical protein